MEKIHARIWLEVTDVRVERLQDIKSEDILKEGVRYNVVQSDIPGKVNPVFKISGPNNAISFMPKNWEELPEELKEDVLLYAHWAELWSEINGPESWQANPWVWVVSFKLLSTTGKV